LICSVCNQKLICTDSRPWGNDMQQRKYVCICKKRYTTQEVFAQLITKKTESKRRAMEYKPVTTFAGATPFVRGPEMDKVPPPSDQRVYKRGNVSPNAQKVLEYIKNHSGVKSSELKSVLGIKSIHRYVNCLHEDLLIDVSTHKNPIGRPYRRCWIRG